MSRYQLLLKTSEEFEKFAMYRVYPIQTHDFARIVGSLNGNLSDIYNALHDVNEYWKQYQQVHFEKFKDRSDHKPLERAKINYYNKFREKLPEIIYNLREFLARYANLFGRIYLTETKAQIDIVRQDIFNRTIDRVDPRLDTESFNGNYSKEFDRKNKVLLVRHWMQVIDRIQARTAGLVDLLIKIGEKQNALNDDQQQKEWNKIYWSLGDDLSQLEKMISIDLLAEFLLGFNFETDKLRAVPGQFNLDVRNLMQTLGQKIKFDEEEVYIESVNPLDEDEEEEIRQEFREKGNWEGFGY